MSVGNKVYPKELSLSVSSITEKDLEDKSSENHIHGKFSAGSEEVEKSVSEGIFTHHFKPSTVQVLQIIACSFTLAPIRIIIVLIIFIIAYIVTAIGYIGLADEDLKSAPLVGWRASVQEALCRLVRATFFVIGIHSITVIGEKAPAEIAPILVGAPHSTIIDTIPVLQSRARPVIKSGVLEFLAKFMQVRKVPIIAILRLNSI